MIVIVSQLETAIDIAMKLRKQPILKILLDALGGFVSLYRSFHTYCIPIDPMATMAAALLVALRNFSMTLHAADGPKVKLTNSICGVPPTAHSEKKKGEIHLHKVTRIG